MNYSLIAWTSAIENKIPQQPAIEMIDRYGTREWVLIPLNRRAWRHSNIQQLKEFVRVPTDQDARRAQ